MQSLGIVGKRFLIIGMGMSGRSAAEFLLASGAHVHGIDANAQLLATHPDIQSLKEAGCTFQREQDCHDLSRFDCVILSPGISPQHPMVQIAKQKNLPLFGEIELGCRFVKNPMVGVTGTNGKTTVTLLITHILKNCGKLASALGNVGVPFTRELLHLSPFATIILELSSYQIETLYQHCFNTAVVLNVTPDHMDRHKTMEAYAQAKCGIERCLKDDGQLYMEERAWEQYGYLLKKAIPRLYGYSKTSFVYTDLQSVFRAGIRSFELPLSLQNKKSHDLENFLAAYAICRDHGVEEKAFLGAWYSFNKPPHRIEFVCEYQGIRFYDDSKGTNIDAVIRAVDSLDGPIRLIVGGVDKGASYSPWIEVFKNKVKSICAIGQAAVKIRDQLASDFSVTIFSSFEEAIQQAARMAQKGENVLLSPGCSSLDMFTDYAHRGREFQRIVRELKELRESCQEKRP